MLEHDRFRTPWWSWLLPACFMLLCVSVFWPRPYLIPSGDCMKYYSGARHLAKQGIYYEDYLARPAQPLTMHPPLLSLMWAALMRSGLEPFAALWCLHAFFLAVLGAIGGAMAYRISGSACGVLIWVILGCCWPGGVNWVNWVRPLTESETAAFFMAVAWMLSVAWRSRGPRETLWLLLAGTTAGLAMLLKVSGAFSFPVIGLAALAMWKRRNSRRWGLIVLVVALLTVLPYSLWAWRNLTLVGVIESNKPFYPFGSTLPLYRVVSSAMAQWLLPPQLAGPVAEHINAFVVVGGVVLAAVLLCLRAWRLESYEALFAGTIGSCAFMILGLALTVTVTEEPRRWNVMLPVLSLVVLTLRAPASRFAAQTMRVLVTLFLMFCCARFAAYNRSLWYACSFGFIWQQAFLASCLVGGVYYLHRAVREYWRDPDHRIAHVAACTFCAVVAVGFWKFGSAPRPLYVYVPLLALGVVMSLAGEAHRRTAIVRWSLSLTALTATWWLGKWSPDDLTLPPVIYYDRDGARLKITASELRARDIVRSGDYPDRYASNIGPLFTDLFEDHAQLKLPEFRNIPRFRSGLPQSPQDDAQAIAQWLRYLKNQRITEPFLIVHLPQLDYRAYYYGPEQLQQRPELDVRWVVHDPELHLAICKPHY